MSMGKKFWRVLFVSAMFILGSSLIAPAPGVKAASLYGKNNEEKIFYFLMQEMHLNNAAGAGVLANVEKESSFRTDAVSDGGTSYGICQWHAERMSRLRAWCENNDYDWKELEGQLYYLEYELNTYYPYTLSVLQGVKNSGGGAYRAGHDWCYYFEVPADREARADERGELAKNTYWPKYKNAKVKLNKGKKYTTDAGVFKAVGDFEVVFLRMTDAESPELTIPGKVTIGEVSAKVIGISPNACKGNKNLTDVTIGANVTKIGKKAFCGCTNLQEITIKSKKIKSFEKGCFKNISSEATFYVKGTVKKDYAGKLKKVAPEGIEIEKF